MPDIFDEVSEDLRADQARSLLRRYGGVLIAAMLLTLAGVGAYTWWQDRQQAAADATAVKFLAAQKQSQLALPPKTLAQQFGDIAAQGPDGYRVLAKLQLAALDWQAGRHDQAAAEWHAVADDTHAPQILRDLATITRAQHQVDSGDAAALKADLQPIVKAGGALRPLAIQVNALLDLRLGRSKEAIALMRSLLTDPTTPQALRQMTQSLLVVVTGDPAAADATP